MTQTLIVNNIKCNGCGTSIISKLSKIEGITNVSVDPTSGKVTFDSSNESSLLDQVKATLDKMGYPEGDPNILQTAKSYVSCMVGRMK